MCENIRMNREDLRDKDKKMFTVYHYINNFKDIDIAKALLTKGYKNISPIMDRKTFNQNLEHPLIKDIIQTLA